MAFSTQINFMKLDPPERRYDTLEPNNNHSADIKHYFSCNDARAWSIDVTQRNLYLSDVIAHCQDNDTLKHATRCFCEGSMKCGMGKSNGYDMSDRKPLGLETEKNMRKTSNIVNTELVYGSNTSAEGDQRENNNFISNTLISRKIEKIKHKHQDMAQNSDEKHKKSPGQHFRNQQQINEANSSEVQHKNNSQVQENEKGLLPKSGGSVKEKESRRQTENEKVINELLDDASPSSDREGSIEIFNITEKNHELPSDDNREIDSNENTLSDISYNFLRPVSLRTTIGNLVGDGDCEKHRQNIRELIKIKGEETLSELKLILHNYEEKFEYYKQICKDRKVQLQNVKKRSPQKTLIELRPSMERFENQTHRKPVTGSIPTINVHRRPQYQPSSLKRPSIAYLHPRFTVEYVSNQMTQGLPETRTNERAIPCPSLPNQENPYEDLFFNKPNSVFHFDNAKRSIDAAEQAIGALKNIDIYSDELAGAVKKLTQVIKEFTKFKDTLREVLKAGASHQNHYIQPAQMAGASGLGSNKNPPIIQQGSENSSRLAWKYPERLLERRATIVSKQWNDYENNSKKQYVSLERCPNFLSEIHRHFINQKLEIQKLNSCKDMRTNILKTDCADPIKRHQHTNHIQCKDERVHEYMADIDADFKGVNVIGFAKYSSKRGPSANIVPSSHSMLCYDLGVDLHIEKLSFECNPTGGRKLKKMFEAKMLKLQNEMELISNQISYKTMVTNSQLDTESVALKEKRNTEKSVLKLCRKIRALEANVFKIKTTIIGHDKIVYNPFEQFCAKRTLKRIQALQMNLRRIRATAEFKGNLLQAVREAKDRRVQQNESLKQDIDLARKIIEGLEDQINKFQSIVCGEVYNQCKSNSQSCLNSRPSAKIVKPLPPGWHSAKKSTCTINQSAQCIKWRKVQKPSQKNEPFTVSEQASRIVRSNTPSEMYQNSLQNKSVSSEQPHTSEIEIEIAQTINLPIEQAPSTIVIKPPMKLYSSDSLSEEKLVLKEEKSSLNRFQGSSMNSMSIESGLSKQQSFSMPANVNKTKESFSHIDEGVKMISKSREQEPIKGRSTDALEVSLKSEANRFSKEKVHTSSVVLSTKEKLPIQNSLPGVHDSMQGNNIKHTAQGESSNLTFFATSSQSKTVKKFPNNHSEPFDSRKGENHAKNMFDSTRIVDENQISKNLTTPKSLNIIEKTDIEEHKFKQVSSEEKLKQMSMSKLGNISLGLIHSEATTPRENSLGLSQLTEDYKKHTESVKSMHADKFDNFPLQHSASHNDVNASSGEHHFENINGVTLSLLGTQQKNHERVSTPNNDKFSQVSITSHDKPSAHESIKENKDGSVLKDNKNVSLPYLPMAEQNSTTSRIEHRSKSKINEKKSEKLFSRRDSVNAKRNTSIAKNIEPDHTKVEDESQYQSFKKSFHSQSTFFESNPGKISSVEKKQTENIESSNTRTKEKSLESLLTSSQILNIKDQRCTESHEKILENIFELNSNLKIQSSSKITQINLSNISLQTGHLRYNTTKPDKLQHSQEQPKSGTPIETLGEMIQNKTEISLTREVLQKRKEQTYLDYDNEIEELKLELSALKQKSEQLYKNELLHKNRIQTLEEELSKAKQVNRFQEGVKTIEFEKDIVDWINKYEVQVQDNESKMLKNLNYQQQITDLQSNLKKSQEELTRLQEIHSSCPRLDDAAANVDCSRWEETVRAFRAKIEMLEAELMKKDEQLKRVQQQSDFLGKEQRATDLKSMWLSYGAELRKCKEQLEAFYSGRNDKIVKELHEQLLKYERDNKKLNKKVIHSDNQVAKIQKIDSSLKCQKIQSGSKCEYCTCAKKTRLEKICVKILKKGIHKLTWNDLAYLHGVVYKTGCAMRGFNFPEKCKGLQCCGDATRNATKDHGRMPMSKITKLEREASGVQNLIFLLKQECHHF